MIRQLLTIQKHSERVAVFESDRAWTYAELFGKACKIRQFLPQKQQRRVAILLPDGGNYIAAFWGTVMAGMTAFPLNILMTEHEILPLLRQASVSAVITSTAYRHLFEKMDFDCALPFEIIFIDEPEPPAHGVEYEAAKSINVDAGSTMMLLSTSGTTGKSKIVQLSEKNVETAVLGYLDKLRFTDAELNNVRYILAAPFSSVYGMMIVAACLLRAFPIIVLGSNFTLDAFYLAAEKYQATNYEGSASPILLMEQTAGRTVPYDIKTLKYIGFGGSKVSGSTIEKVQKAFPHAGFFQGYGMTEASPLIAKHPHEQLKKADSVGTAVKGVKIAVSTDDGGITAEPYVNGEIVVKGANVMLGYLDNKAETDRVLKNGYLYTGDIGYLDDEGYLYICGRKKNVIIVRGFNVYPEEVEGCIQNSMLAKDCFVYGQTDAYGNETVCLDLAPINPQVTDEDIRAYCNEHLAEYKRPQRISLCKSIRKNAAGKTKRH